MLFSFFIHIFNICNPSILLGILEDRSKMKTCIEIRSKAFYKLNRDIMTLLEESVKYTQNQSLDSIHAHNTKAFKSKKLKLRKFQYKYVKI